MATRKRKLSTKKGGSREKKAKAEENKVKLAWAGTLLEDLYICVPRAEGTDKQYILKRVEVDHETRRAAFDCEIEINPETRFSLNLVLRGLSFDYFQGLVAPSASDFKLAHDDRVATMHISPESGLVIEARWCLTIWDTVGLLHLRLLFPDDLLYKMPDSVKPATGEGKTYKLSPAKKT